MSASSAWTEVGARQRQIGRALRRHLDPIVDQSVPQQMIELLQRADARLFAAAGREFDFARARPAVTSITVAMAIVAIPILIWALYVVISLATAHPASMIAVAYVAGLGGIFAGAAWLIEGN